MIKILIILGFFSKFLLRNVLYNAFKGIIKSIFIYLLFKKYKVTVQNTFVILNIIIRKNLIPKSFPIFCKDLMNFERIYLQILY